MPTWILWDTCTVHRLVLAVSCDVSQRRFRWSSFLELPQVLLPKTAGEEKKAHIPLVNKGNIISFRFASIFLHGLVV